MLCLNGPYCAFLARGDDRLHDRFRLLTTSSSDLRIRLWTLRATLDESWGLPEAQERAPLGRCSVFAGGLTLEEAVRAG
jgi:predicted ATPase